VHVRFRRRAEQEVEDAARWYDIRLAGLGLRFIDEVDRVVGEIAERPTAYPSVHRDTRRALVATFPFAVYYLVRGDTVVVVAIVHVRRHPRSWHQRQ
jgi:plasmid stabilization system protein ParE